MRRRWLNGTISAIDAVERDTIAPPVNTSRARVADVRVPGAIARELHFLLSPSDAEELLNILIRYGSVVDGVLRLKMRVLYRPGNGGIYWVFRISGDGPCKRV